ncbi:vacuolar protein-sorting-associated protein 25-like [Saccoglossus kowalevskii]|uniref:Vacuolar protein-sorting-associated protein 25 n=1 Tax=Saccoglossus kowalevskii TaxID=10224 RepID=A0ABM0GND9_SACKO|nr:PREDICTED: vacuolar protein-sorting-associated protein 25-like [Saccoglossus kowalevskii]
MSIKIVKLFLRSFSVLFLRNKITKTSLKVTHHQACADESSQMAAPSDFEWPWQYNFPPFFTLQPNLETRQTQLEAWCSLVLSYHKHYKIFSLDVTEVQSSPLFSNSKINRKLPLDALYIVLEELRKKGNLEWLDKNRKRCLIMWRTPEEWGSLIYQWASSNSLLNSVCTLYELVSGDDTVKEEFHDLDGTLLRRALKTLQVQMKAEIIVFDGNEGVKFF